MAASILTGLFALPQSMWKWVKNNVIDDIAGNLAADQLKRPLEAFVGAVSQEIEAENHRQEAESLVHLMDESEEKRFIMSALGVLKKPASRNYSIKSDSPEEESEDTGKSETAETVGETPSSIFTQQRKRIDRHGRVQLGLAYLWKSLERGFVEQSGQPTKEVKKKSGEIEREYNLVNEEQVMDYYHEVLENIARGVLDEYKNSSLSEAERIKAQRESFYNWIESYAQKETRGFVAIIAQQSKGFFGETVPRAVAQIPDRLAEIMEEVEEMLAPALEMLDEALQKKKNRSEVRARAKRMKRKRIVNEMENW